MPARLYLPLLMAALGASLPLGKAASVKPVGAPSQVRLAVLVVVDQLPSYELDKFELTLSKAGFGGLYGAGAARFDADYSYATTETSPGHATLATGANPNVHGIIANRWFENGKSVYSVDGSHLMAETLGGALKRQTAGAAQVVAVSLKDRAAILSAGPSGDQVLWLESEPLRFTNSHLPAAALPEWVKPINSQLSSRQIAGQAYRTSKASVLDLFQLALAAIEGQALGRDESPDLLIISISTTDYVGHAFGPESAEAAATLVSVDAELKGLVAALNRRVGVDRWVLGLTSDHGVARLPDVARRSGLDAGHLSSSALVEAARASIAALDRPARFIAFEGPNLYIDQLSEDPGDLLTQVAKRIEAVPGVAQVYLSSDLTSKPEAPGDPFATFYRAVVYPGRSAPLLVRPKAQWVWAESNFASGTNHGSPYLYDRRVPLILVGPGVPSGRISIPIDPRDVAPTLAALLKVSPPSSSQGHSILALAARQ